MVDIRPVPESDLPAFRRLHNRYTDSAIPLARFETWHREAPNLLLGAYDDGNLVGHCLGIADTGSSNEIELRGISVAEDHRRRGIGSALLDAFEARVAARGAGRVTLGSAGGYVDEFYRRNGYEPRSVLVRLAPEDVPDDDAELGYEIVEERTVDGVRKLYVGVDGFDPDFPDEVGDAFGDPEAIHIMEKRVSERL